MTSDDKQQPHVIHTTELETQDLIRIADSFKDANAGDGLTYLSNCATEDACHHPTAIGDCRKQSPSQPECQKSHEEALLNKSAEDVPNAQHRKDLSASSFRWELLALALLFVVMAIVFAG